MNLTTYKESIKTLIDSTNNETLLKHWKKQLEWDVEHQDELELSREELNLVREGLVNYNNGEVLSFEEYISKRR